MLPFMARPLGIRFSLKKSAVYRFLNPEHNYTVLRCNLLHHQTASWSDLPRFFFSTKADLIASAETYKLRHLYKIRGVDVFHLLHTHMTHLNAWIETQSIIT